MRAKTINMRRGAFGQPSVPFLLSRRGIIRDFQLSEVTLKAADMKGFQRNYPTCAVRFYSHTTKLGTQIQWICSFLGHYKRNLSLSEPDILIVILIDHFDSSKGTAPML